jgi:hypothetical protein
MKCTSMHANPHILKANGCNVVIYLSKQINKAAEHYSKTAVEGVPCQYQSVTFAYIYIVYTLS